MMFLIEKKNGCLLVLIFQINGIKSGNIPVSLQISNLVIKICNFSKNVHLKYMTPKKYNWLKFKSDLLFLKRVTEKGIKLTSVKHKSELE